mmetsp:Transcript_49740/g.158866  ORF Transcript_49740/g.158866 Transcript_49740/m.158866 type:complete len:156 (-) Transcript_49740:877-1344(-)
MNFIVCLIVAFSIFFFSTNIKADVEVTQTLNFGIVAVLDNTSAHTYAIDESGNISISGGFAIIAPGNPGAIRLSNYPGNIEVFVNGVVITAVLNPGQISQEYFVFTSVNVPPTVRTNSLGEEEFTFGGTIQTSGSGSIQFVDAQYAGQLRIDLNY